MIESLMLMALGFFVATLFALATARLVWRRAVTVTERRLGIENDPDTADAGRSAELDALLARQRRELEPLHNEIAALNQKNEALQEDSASLQAELTAARAALAAREAKLERLAGAFAALAAALSAAGRHSDEARQALETAVETATRLAADLAPAEPVAAPDAAVPLTPYPDQEGETDRQTLAEIAASIHRMDHENPQDSAENSDDDSETRLTAEAHLGDRALAARIRALEAGVAS